ncbi:MULTISPECIES: hypothetical protein [Pseudomonas]|jgi:acyl carrier protein|uniref:Acyl carrier protein n=1 Tax=Pseudomonas mandelii TaxID=75612 RepID=A0AB36CRK2_9PSED|nr:MULTISPECIES: hypothetical protein [Pseudomonas]MBU0525919.1 acyl carrier protein [Gammaproteobacteria bacterium]MDF9883180.1 acyl carrier protein [Pseudomonas silensiensis]MBU0818867.1 acyl carrier protein [Gammaproteobacteria bacterium]MBU0844271.1 acyl carrier protein [Gammaproteobacteria bacterium]MBU1843574.1 acyl carrier protein [Gammaproteobacteria bacterium]
MKEQILGIIYNAIENENRSLVQPISLEKGEDTALYGAGGVLDSMSLVSIVIDVEQMIEEQLGVKMTLVNDSAMSPKRSPFQSVKTFANYILELNAQVSHAR